MNREILFKAKRKDWRTLPKEEWWVEGDLIQTTFNGIKRMWISSEEYDNARLRYVHKYVTEWRGIEIDPDTLCQYTGLTDKNGQKIWENDILKGYQYPFLLSEGKENYYAEVVWFTNCNAFGTYTFKNPRANVRGISEGNTELMENWNPEDWEVIGNIFDNADLLEME